MLHSTLWVDVFFDMRQLASWALVGDLGTIFAQCPHCTIARVLSATFPGVQAADNDTHF